MTIKKNMLVKRFEALGVDVEADKYDGVPLLHFKKNGEPFTICMVFDFGAYWELGDSTAHYLEHLILCGGDAYADKKSLAEAFDARGCSFNAWTSYLNLGIKELNNSEDDLSLAAATLGDIVLCSKIGTNSVEKERSVILAEREKTDKEKNRVCINLFFSVLFPGTRLAKDIKGDGDDILAVSQQDLIGAHDLLLHSKKAIITAGDFSLSKVKDALEPFLKKVSAFKHKDRTSKHIRIRKGDFMVSNHLGISGVGIFFDRPIYGDKRKTAIHMFISTLLFGKSGILMERLRYENSLVYNVPDYSMTSSVIDFWGVFIEVPRQQINKACELLSQTVMEYLCKHLNADELRKFIESSKSRERRQYRTADALIDRYSLDYLHFGQNIAWHDDYLSILKVIPIKEIIAEARNVFNKDNQTVIITS